MSSEASSEARRIELKLHAPPGDIRRYAAAIAAGAVIEYAEEGEVPDSMAERNDEDADVEDDADDGADERSAGDESAAVAAAGGTPPPGADADVPPADAPPSEPPAAASFTCPGCGRSFVPPFLPTDGLLTCPGCDAQFFGAVHVSDEDREAEERLRLAYEDRAQRLGDLHQNKVLLERRHQFRTRTYVILGAAALVLTAWQLCALAAARNRTTGSPGIRGGIYLALAAVALWFVWPCVRKIRAINRALATPVLTDPDTPPDFSTLSDGSQLVDQEVRNLERLSGKKS
jgi:hypothetical protein